jgi:hypothetical protein
MIQQLVRQIANQLTVEGGSPPIAPSYIHGQKGWSNLKADKITNTLIILFDPVQSDSKLIGNLMQDKYPLLMLFAEKSKLDWTPDQHLVVIDRMRTLCAQFIYKCTKSGLFSHIEDFVISDEYNAFDVCLSGVGLQIKLTPTIGAKPC